MHWIALSPDCDNAVTQFWGRPGNNDTLDTVFYGPLNLETYQPLGGLDHMCYVAQRILA
jgi:hypothetical protein